MMNTLLLILSGMVLLASLMPLIRHDYWTFRVFDYPRLQKLVLSILLILLYSFFYKGSIVIFWTMISLLALNSVFLLSVIIPYTPLGRKQVLRAKKEDPTNRLRIMVANVLEDNKNTTGCVAEVKANHPDIILLLETNKRWERETAILSADYPYQVKIPLENTYGMLLYSRFPLENTQIRYLVENDIPSIHTEMVLPSGLHLTLHCVHPTPPVPSENPRSTERDRELLLVADMAKASDHPVIVIGDLNDVAWSYTTTLFLKMSELLDPRRGRGFFNTFHAHYPFLRFPLDHAFCSPHFKLLKLKRLNNFDSDHFPILVSLQYEQTAEAKQEDRILEADEGDYETAEEKKSTR